MVFLLSDLLGGIALERFDFGVAEFAVVIFVEGFEVEIGGAGEVFAHGLEFGSVDFAVGVSVVFFYERGGGGVALLALALGGVGGRGEEAGGDGEGEAEEEAVQEGSWIILEGTAV